MAWLFYGLLTIGFLWSRCEDKILLRNVETLEMRANKYTTGRRLTPVPQISCEGGCTSHGPSVVHCSNAGSEGNQLKWRCFGLMRDDTELENVSLSCEGYDYAEDPHILQGSCALRYTLKPAGGGKEEQGSAGALQKHHHEFTVFSEGRYPVEPVSVVLSILAALLGALLVASFLMAWLNSA